MARTPYYPNDPYSNQIPHLPIDASQTPQHQIYVIPHSGKKHQGSTDQSEFIF